MTQQIIVGLIVALAATYAVWRWMPGPWRRALAARIASGTQRAGLVDAERAQQMAASLAKSSGCGSCDSCGSCAPPKGAPAAKAGSSSSLPRAR